MYQKQQSKKDKFKISGFTLIELIVVMSILAILVLLATPKLLGYSDKARTTQITNDIKVLETKIDEYLIEHEEFPASFSDGVPGEGQLYDRTGKIEAAPSNLKVVDRTFYPETELPGTFYTDPDGEVIYEDDKVIASGPDNVKETPHLTNEEITDLINAGYIPVADADELRQIAVIDFDETNTPIYKELTWGKGTKWEGQYIGRLDSMYVQVADIDLSSYSEGAGWLPIGYYMDTDGDGSSEDFYFSGTYNGGNFTISNLYINRPSQNYFGLFGQIDGAKILNVMMTAPTLIAESDIGALVGYGMNDNSISNIKITGLDMTINDGWYSGGMIGDIYDESNLENLSIEGTITLNGDTGKIGGLIGCSEAIIYNAYANVNIIGNSDEAYQVGGLIGYIFDSIIEKSHSDGDVQGNLYVGGLIGKMDDINVINNSYSTGTVIGHDYAGGLVGLAGDEFGQIIDSHSVSEVVSSGSNSGGLVGDIVDTTVIVTNSYYYQGTDNGIGTKVPKTDMAKVLTFIDWDFENIWGIVNNEYPEFIKGDSEADREPVKAACSTVEYTSPVLSTESDNRFLDNLVHVTADYTYGISKSNNKQIIITEYLGSETDVIIPCRINGLNVVEIGNYLWNGNRYGAFSGAELTSVTIPYGVVKIGEDAFSYSKFTSLIIPDTVVDIGKYAFSQNKNLTSVTFGKQLVSIGYGAFQGNALTSVRLSPYLKTIGEYAFENNETIETLVLNERLEHIGNYAFNTNKISSDLVFPQSLKTIGEDAFGYNQIKSIFIPGSVQLINWYAFNNNPTINSITVNYNNPYYMSYDNAIYTKDGNKLLVGSSNTKTILPIASIIEEAAFYGMGVTTITLGNNLKSIEHNAFNGNPITSIVIPASVTNIGSRAFQNVPLTSLTLHEGLQIIGDSAFSSNKLTGLIIPSTVTSIKSQAFIGNSLLKVYINRPSSSGLLIGSRAFERFNGGNPVIDYTPWD